MDNKRSKIKRFTDPPVLLNDGYIVDNDPKTGEEWLDTFNRATREQEKRRTKKPKSGEQLQ